MWMSSFVASYPAVFSLAYLRHVGPTSLQYKVSFDVGMGIFHTLCFGHRLHPIIYANLSCLEFSLGENTAQVLNFLVAKIFIVPPPPSPQTHTHSLPLSHVHLRQFSIPSKRFQVSKTSSSGSGRRYSVRLRGASTRSPT